ncbi:MAG: LAGLIDADG family homing endonuclease [Halobacteriota archaeon]|uniref:LAGLIDADG family homing endonuclease n=1 Tax=Natronomonas sp. TaxID=2184060 RepID=UPI0039756083
MARAENTEVIDKFEGFYRDYYRNEIGQLAQKYPNEKRSLYIGWDDLYRFDPDLADDFIAQPDQMRDYAEEALRLYDLPVDVKLGQAHVRIKNLQKTTGIRDIRARHRGQLVEVTGIIRKATDVRPKITEAAFECQRCGTLTRIPQTSGDFYEPHECQGCERQGPFDINFDQSEFVDAQKLRVQESPEGLRGGETPQSIDVHIDDDITGRVTAGDHVRVTGVLHLDQQGSNQEKSPIFDVYMDGMSVEIEDEQFEDMDITDEDKKRIIELSNESDIYEKMIASMAPSIYGYDQEKLAIIMQLFSGVTKHLPDGSRTRGDLHMLLIGDPGTGKCARGETKVTLSDGSEVPLEELVESNLDDPKPIDDGVYDEVDFEVPSMSHDGVLTRQRATKVWKRESPERMYRVETATGRTLEVTPSHPLFVSSGGCLRARQTKALEEGEFIAAPRSLPVEGDDTLDVSYRRSKANNAVRLEAPDRLTPGLARLIGYIVAEGYVEHRDDNTDSVWLTNNDREILDDAASVFDRLGVNYFERKPHRRKTANGLVCSSEEFVRFLENLEPAMLERSAEQRVPSVLFRATRPCKAGFLRAYIDGECTVSDTERELSIASMSRELLEGVRTLLLSFEIQAQLQPGTNGSYRLGISGRDFERYRNQIGFVTHPKPDAATECEGISANTDADIVPNIGNELREIRERLELSQFDCGLPRTTYRHYERGDRDPSRSSLRTVLSVFSNRLDELSELRESVSAGDWNTIVEVRDELNISQASLASKMGVEQTAVSYCERNEVVPDGGRAAGAEEVVLERIDAALSVEADIERLRALVDSDIVWDRIDSIEAVVPDYEWVYDLEVEGTHSYVSNNVISHNSQLLQYVRNLAPRSVYTSGKGSSSAGLTAAAVRDDFGDGQQWTLEAGALVLADQGIAAVDELDKMRPEDRSAMHEALEQQSISVSKAGINATLKSRCSLLGAANPKYGRFDQYESIGEQIDLEPALISRFDLIFTVTDQPDAEKDANLADHIINTNYAGELFTHRENTTTSNVSKEEVENVTENVEPEIDAELLRKYIAYAKRNCYPMMTEEAKVGIRDFYVDLRSKGQGDDAPVPVTARKLEALVRLSEASARMRLSDTVEREDAERVIEIVRSCLKDIGVDPETGEFDADVVETGRSKSQRDRIKNIKSLISEIETEYDEGAPIETILDRAEEIGMDRSQAEHEIEKLRRQGDVYEPSTDHLRTV